MYTITLFDNDGKQRGSISGSWLDNMREQWRHAKNRMPAEFTVTLTDDCTSETLLTHKKPKEVQK